MRPSSCLPVVDPGTRLRRPGFVARDTWLSLAKPWSIRPVLASLVVMTLSLETSRASAPTLSLSLSRVGVTNVEKVIRIRANGAEQLFSARLDCFVDLGPHQKGAHMSRFEEVVNDAIGEVVLGESALRAETLAAAHRREGARPPGRAARRGAHRGALPGAQAGAGVRASRRRRSTRCSAPPWPREAGTRRLIGVARAGHDRLPVRPDARRRPARASGCWPTASPRTRSSASSRPSPWPPTTSAGWARCTSAARRTATTDIDAQRLLAHRRGLDVLGDLRADEALRRGRRGREGPPPAALRRGLRARDGPRRRRAAGLPHRRRTSSRPARRTSRRSTSTTSVAERFGLLGEMRARSRTGEHSRITRRCASGSTASA